MTTTTATRYNVIVESVGTANPVVSKILSESLNVPVEMVSKAIYKAPAVLFHNIDEELANKASDLLTQMGLQVSLKPEGEFLPATTNLVDVGIYVNDVSQLPLVCQQLRTFMGCEIKEALALLMNENSIVMGNISMATAEALSQRIDAEVMVCDPAKDLYTIEWTDTGDRILNAQFVDFLKTLKVDTENVLHAKRVEDLDYDTTQKVWLRFQSGKNIKIINQSFLRYEIILEKADTTHPKYKEVLIQEVGMPPQIIPQVIDNLPVQLHESVVFSRAVELTDSYKAAGLECSILPVYKGDYHLSIQHITDLEKTRTILSDYFDKEQLPSKAGKWHAPKALNNLIARYILFQLEHAACIAELKPASI